MRKTTWLAVGVFAALFALTLYLNGRESPDAPLPPTASAEAPLFLLEEEEGNPLVFVQMRRGEEIFQMRRGEDGLWVVELPEDAPDPEAGMLEGAASQLLAIPLVAADLTVSEADVGLQKQTEAGVVSVKFADGTESAFRVGDPTPSGQGYYVEYDGKIGIVASYNLDALFQLFALVS